MLYATGVSAVPEFTCLFKSKLLLGCGDSEGARWKRADRFRGVIELARIVFSAILFFDFQWLLFWKWFIFKP
jgi:hypothetical protein